MNVDQRVDQDGSLELQRHWKLFRRTGQSIESVDHDAVIRDWQRHTEPPSVATLALLTVVATALAFGWVRFSFPAVESSSLNGLLIVWTAINLTLLLIHLRTLAVRHWWVPMEPLIGRSLAMMLPQDRYQPNPEHSESQQEFRNRLAELGIGPLWDCSTYQRLYERHEGEWQIANKTPEQIVHQQLGDFLGRKDSATRNFQRGKYFASLKDGKASVSRFINSNADTIGKSRTGSLPIEQGLALLRLLLDTEITPKHKGYKALQTFLDAADQGWFGLSGCIKASIWERNPWNDLTHQQEFFSSASLRGVRKVGRSSKGRLGPFLYLQNPSISALDFSDSYDRRVRARIAVTTTDVDGIEIPILFVDGIEGTNSVDRELIQKAILSYADACGFHAVAFHKYPHNQVPRYFLVGIDTDPARVILLRYCDMQHKQYLDAFGWPIEPFEYAVPNGQVVAYLVNTSRRSRELPSLGAAESKWDQSIAILRRSSLWLILASGLGYAMLTIGLTMPWALVPLLSIAVFSIASHLKVQMLGMKRTAE